MTLFTRLPGFRRSPAGLEWAIWRRLPAILLWGTAAPLLVAAVFWWVAPVDSGGTENRDLLLVWYRLIGIVILHWTLVLTLAIGCAIVMLMKGPAYAADRYPPADRDDPA